MEKYNNPSAYFTRKLNNPSAYTNDGYDPAAFDGNPDIPSVQIAGGMPFSTEGFLNALKSYSPFNTSQGPGILGDFLGTKEQPGFAPTALGFLQGLQAFSQGNSNRKLGEQAFKQQMEQSKAGFANAVKTTQSAQLNRERSRLSGTGVGFDKSGPELAAYMDKYGVKA